MHKKRILVAALNWGLGHATRCIPIIHALEKNGFIPVIASDGPALLLLKKEFPRLDHHELPSYNIRYSKRSELLKLKLLLRTPEILEAISKENKQTADIVNYDISGIISDSRFGVRHPRIWNVFITHQLTVLSGSTTYFSTKLHQNYLQKFDESWIPDSAGPKNLSGILGHAENFQHQSKYIGALSRFQKKNAPIAYDILLLLSGPEPQRSLLERIFLKEFAESDKKILLVRGVMEENEILEAESNIKIVDYLLSEALEHAINSSELIIARSGYSTIMDLSRMEKRAFFIPTPGQYEQEYLAARLKSLGIAPCCKQEDFNLQRLDELKHYSGLKDVTPTADFTSLFSLFLT